MNISISNLIDNATRPGTVDPLAAALMAEWPMKDDGVQSKGPVAANLLTGSCYDAPNSGNGISISSAINFSGNYTFAISVSFKANPTGSHPIWEGVNGANLHGLYVDGGDWDFLTGSVKISHPYGTWSPDRWDRVVCVYDGSNYIMYINGVSVTTGASGNGALYLEDILQDATGAGGNAANALGGKMEVYSAAWTASDVTFDYNEKNSADGLFVFDNGTSAITYADAEIIYPGASASSTILDYSGNSNNGGGGGFGFFSTNSLNAPYNSRCIQLANWRDGYNITGSGRGTVWNFPDPNNPTQAIGGLTFGHLKKTSVSADEGMNFVMYSNGGGGVEIPDNTVLTMDGAEGFSVSFWIFIGATPAPTAIGVLMDKGGLSITMTAADELGFALVATNANQMKDSTAGTASAGWNHICFTYNGTDETKLYLNGTETGSDSFALGAGIKDNTEDLFFGNAGALSSGGSGRNMNWLGWYNTALTPTQVTTVYNARLGVH